MSKEQDRDQPEKNIPEEGIETTEASTANTSRRNFLKGSATAAAAGLDVTSVPGLAAAATDK
jgi:hypothetical protein